MTTATTPDASTIVRSAKAFEFYAQKVWPWHRRLVRGKLAPRCSRCALSSHREPLGADGLCAPCRTAPAVAAAPKRIDHAPALHALLAANRGAGRGAFDALLLFSGGKDSVYMLRRIRDEHPGLRVLALSIDNTFMSPIARENIDRMVARMDVDHLMVRHSRAFMARLFGHCLTHLNADGGYGTVDFSDGELILDTARRVAAEQAIPLILCGYSRYQVENGLKLSGFESPRERELSDRTETAGIPLTDITSGDGLRHWWRASDFPAERVARMVFPMAAWDLEEDDVRAAVRQWGLVRGGYDSPIVTNHALIPLIGVVDVHQLGYSSFEVEFCRMIREGKADLQHWRNVFELLEYTSRTGMFVRPPVDQGLAMLGLTHADLGIRFDS